MSSTSATTPVPLKVHSSKPSLAASLSSTLVASALSAISSRGSFTVALSGGSIPAMLSYSNVAAAFASSGAEVSFENWHVFLADERVVAPDSPDSSLLALRTDSFLNHPDAVSPPKVYGIKDPSSSSVKEISEDYAEMVTAALSSFSSDRFDLVVLGMGEDGHTCSLFPSHPLLTSSLSASPPPPVVDYLTDSPKHPPSRITLTLPTLNASRSAVFAAAGAGKASVLSQIFTKTSHDESTSTSSCTVATGTAFPCGLVRPADGALLWLVDDAAVSML